MTRRHFSRTVLGLALAAGFPALMAACSKSPAPQATDAAQTPAPAAPSAAPSTAAAPATMPPNAATPAAAPATSAPQDAKSAPQIKDKLAAAKGAPGVTVGEMMARREVTIFFDSQCPHCSELWRASQSQLSHARFHWVPVAILNPRSLTQGATILGASDPAALMAQNEAAIAQHQEGIEPDDKAVEKFSKDVQANTDLFTALGATGVPFLVTEGSTPGQAVTSTGAMTEEQLSKWLANPVDQQ